MGSPLFIDTSAFVGFFAEKDQRHRDARSAFSLLTRRGRRFVTSTDVFGETLTTLRARTGHRRAAFAGNVLRSRALADMADIDDAIRDHAWRLFCKYDDQELSFIDCTSFAVMDRLGIREAFTFDDDFRRVGYQTLP